MILKNPGGRIVDVSDKDGDYWLTQPGFEIPSGAEIEQWRGERSKWFEKPVLSEVESVYFSMLSSKGKLDGYGTAGDLIFKGLKDLGLNMTEVFDDQKVGILFHSPYSIMRLETRYKILFTMFESNKLPDDWKEYIDYADKVIVPSKWCQAVFENDGYSTEVVNLGYNDDVYHYIDRPKRDGTFKFLHYNAFNLRKGFNEVLEAFQKAFNGNEYVRLVLKTNRKYHLPLVKSEYPNIDVIDDEYTPDQLAKLCGDCDAFVFPSRGEGFGLTPLEAMATGLPTIVPNAHGISEYFNPEFMWGVKATEEVPATYSRYKGQYVGKMVMADVDDLAQQMLDIYNHKGEAKLKAKAASDYVKAFTYKRTARELKAIIEQVLASPLPAKKTGRILPLERV